MKRSRMAAAVLALVGGLAASTVAAQPASAAPGMVRVAVQTAQNGDELKEILAPCPTHTRVYGGGGYVTGGGRRVHLIRLQPSSTQNGWLAAAQEIPGGADVGEWRLYAYAICGPALPGLQYVADSSGQDSQTAKDAHATCPGFKLLVAAGARVVDGEGTVVIDDLQIGSDSQTVHAWAVEREGGSAAVWGVWAFAVCADRTGLPGYGVAELTSANNPNDKNITVSCPAGETVYGLGGALFNSGGDAHYKGAAPNAALTSVSLYTPVDETGAPQAWRSTAQAVCAA
jgi:hypothetical protein